MLISAATEETKRYLFNVYEPFNFDFVFKRTLVITSNLTNPESATEVVVFEYTSVISKKKHPEQRMFYLLICGIVSKNS